MPVSRKSSRMSFNRAEVWLSRYSLSPERYNLRLTVTSSCSSARLRSVLSKTRSTCATLLARRVLEPLKIMSIICRPRKLRADCSPSTHLNASTTLLLPHPLGPTIHVARAVKSKSTRSQKLLKPQIERRFRYIGERHLPVETRRTALPDSLDNRPPPEQPTRHQAACIDPRPGGRDPAGSAGRESPTALPHPYGSAGGTPLHEGYHTAEPGAISRRRLHLHQQTGGKPCTVHALPLCQPHAAYGHAGKAVPSQAS